ncbi:MAG: hypothetical protein J6Y43_02410, partial [Clostridia bacterium]|nr:hypothetical protein [Clostridia bacterium]
VKKDGKTYFAIKSFNVYKPLYEVSNYGDVTYGAEKKFDNAEGIKLSLAGNGSVFKLNRKVNIESLENEIPFIKFHIDPETVGVAELNEIFVKVTDAYDPNVFFALEVRYFGDRLDANTRVSVFGYINNFSIEYSDTIVCEPRNGDWLGQQLKASFVGSTEVGELKDQYISFYYNPIKRSVVGADGFGSEKTVLSLASFREIWSGFTNGDTYIEIFGKNFRATKAHLFIDQIGEIDLKTNKFADTEAPEIFIDFNNVEPFNCPKGYVGNSYPVFDATAVDFNEGIKPVIKAVYYNYYSESKVSVAVSNGRFTPQRAGKYTVVYSATDSFGNLAERFIDIEIDGSDAPVFTCSTDEYTTNCTVGDVVNLPTVEFEGYVHDISETISVTKGIKNYEKDIADNKLRVLESGTYVVKFTALDFIGRKCEFSYDLTVVTSDSPIFIDEPDELVTENFIVGYKHKLPEINVVIIGENNTATKVSVNISADKGSVETVTTRRPKSENLR